MMFKYLGQMLIGLLIAVSLQAWSLSRDPTEPLMWQGNNFAKEEGLNIQSIFISRSKRLALIDGIYLVVGDMTRRGKLVAILKDKVVIKESGELRQYFLSNLNIRNSTQ